VIVTVNRLPLVSESPTDCSAVFTAETGITARRKQAIITIIMNFSDISLMRISHHELCVLI
jgi:hypothetical protein